MKSLTDMAGNLDVSTEQVLTALRIVSNRAGVENLTDWATKELEGYEAEDELPTHRSWPLTIVASLHNPYQGFMPNVHVGALAIPEEYRKDATFYHCRDSIGRVESMLSKKEGGDEGGFGVEHPNLAQYINIGPMVDGVWTCTHAHANFSPGHLRAIVTKARQSALSLCLECEKNGIDLQWGVTTTRAPKNVPIG